MLASVCNVAMKLCMEVRQGRCEGAKCGQMGLWVVSLDRSGLGEFSGAVFVRIGVLLPSLGLFCDRVEDRAFPVDYDMSSVVCWGRRIE